MSFRILALLSLSAFVAAACNDDTRSYPPCPLGVTPSEYDCVPTYSDDGLVNLNDPDASSLDVQIRDTSEPFDTTPGFDVVPPEDTNACVPDCRRAECGDDGCGGLCGTCGRDSVCENGRCFDQTDEDSCEEIADCVSDCFDQRCYNRCISAGAPQAQEQFMDAVECINNECGNINDQDAFAQCQEERCFAELSACFDWGPPPIPIEEGCSDTDFARLEDFGDELGFVIAECGLSCQQTRDPAGCATDCTGELGNSESCTQCTGRLANCLGNSCAGPCSDPLSDACEGCLQDGCMDEFENCAMGQ